MKKRLCSFLLSMVLLLGLLPTAALAESGQNFAFAESTVTKTCGDVPFSITLNNLPNHHIVSYKSSDINVATVDASSGVVTIVDAGYTTITATAVLDPNQDPGATAAISETVLTATYTLTVKSLPTENLAAEQTTEVFATDMSYPTDWWFRSATEVTLQSGWSCSPNAVQWHSGTVRFSNFRPVEGANKSSVLYAKHQDNSNIYRIDLTYNYDNTPPSVEVLTYGNDEFLDEWPKNWVVLDINDRRGSECPEDTLISGVDPNALRYYYGADTQGLPLSPLPDNDNYYYFNPTKTGNYKILAPDKAGNFESPTNLTITEIYTDPAPAPTPSVSAPAVLPVTVPVSGEENTVHLSAKITGQSAKLEAVNAEEVAHVSEGLLPAPLTMDLSTVKRPITALTIPAESIALIADASERGNVTGLEIKLPSAALTFDAAALQNIAYAAEDAREITLLTKKTTPNKLSTAQQETLATMPGTMIWEISLLVGKEELHYFGSGTVRVEIPYESTSPYLTVWHLAEDGSVEPLPTRHARNTLSFTTPHFSHFILTEDETNYRHLCPNAYSDIHPSQWHHEGVDYVVENGIMGGYSDGSFRPAASTTRAQIATMLWRLSGKPVVNYLMTFRDAKAEQYYTEAVRWAAAEGIMGGYDSNYFGTHDPVTREQLAAILWRYAKYCDMDVSVGEDTNILSYNDVFDMSEYAIPAMQWACGSGVIMGKDAEGGGMLLLPKNHATRGEIAVMLMRFAEGMR